MRPRLPSKVGVEGLQVPVSVGLWFGISTIWPSFRLLAVASYTAAAAKSEHHDPDAGHLQGERIMVVL